jgi:hypothetical protein
MPGHPRGPSAWLIEREEGGIMSLIHYTAVAVFDDAAQADRAIADLRQKGFREDQIGVVSGVKEPAEPGNEGNAPTVGPVAEGAGVGMIAGASLGGLVGGVAAVPGGALVGGVVGGLVGLGVPEEEAHYYRRELQAGRTVVAVNGNGRYDEAVAVLHDHGGHVDESPLSRTGPGVLP